MIQRCLAILSIVFSFLERDYAELKQELGLRHFEGRNWRGFHRHATLCIAAYGFLIAERTRFSPLPAPAILNSPPPRKNSHAGRRVRPERHNPNSTTTLRITLARQRLGLLPQCPFCGSPRGYSSASTSASTTQDAGREWLEAVCHSLTRNSTAPSFSSTTQRQFAAEPAR